jgi:glyoxylase-like metal-dependent hydrolase (beta-lactamase superfamily II)
MKLDSELYAYPWMSTQENNCNSYLVGGAVPVLIDPGHQHLVKHLITQMEKDKNRPEDFRLIIATHVHPDHFEASQTFARAGVFMTMHPDEEKFMREEGKEFYRGFGMEMPDIRVDFFLKEGELRLGSKTFQVLHTPGHSPGSISLYWPEKKALFTGDAVFYMGVGRTDFPGGDGNLLKESIEKLARLDVELLLSGHGEVIRGKRNIQQNFQYIRENFFDYL